MIPKHTILLVFLPLSCIIHRALASSDTCKETANSEYVYNLVMKKGRIKKNTRSTCEDLNKLSTKKIQKICKSKIVNGGAWEECDITCGTCSSPPPDEWVQLGQTIVGNNEQDEFGRRVAISGDGRTIAVACDVADYVKVLKYASDIGWFQLGSDILLEKQDYTSWQSSTSVSLSDDGMIVAIGDTQNDGNGYDSGHVRIYRYKVDTSQWELLGNDIDGESADDSSGNSVSLSSDGTIVAIASSLSGEYYSDGSVRMFRFDEESGDWEKMGDTIEAEYECDHFGRSVSLSSDGMTVAAGAPYNTYSADDLDSPGHTRVFRYVSGSWIQVGEDIMGLYEDDMSGHSVSLSSDGKRVAIGTHLYDGIPYNSNIGHVRIFEFRDGSWNLLGDEIIGESQYYQSGFSVSLSSDGNKVAIGASAAHYSAGQVRVFEFLNGQWQQVGEDIQGENDYDGSGYSVSLSSDGTKVCVGAPGNDDAGAWSGHVRVFSLV